jgi:hypothetical protein
VAGDVVRFGCTDPNVAERASRRLIDAGSDQAASIRIDLVETDVLGWQAPDTLNAEESILCQRALAGMGLSAIVPTQANLPWVIFDPARRRGLVVVRTTADLPPWMMDAPFSLPLHLAFAGPNRRFVHAASLGDGDRGMLIVGPGGAGKSATTIAGLLGGLSTVGDDYLVLSDDGRVEAGPVYSCLKQSPEGLNRFPELRASLGGLPLNWHGKVEFAADALRPTCLASKLVISAILIPRQGTQRATSFEPAPPTAAFSAMAHSTLEQLPGDGVAGFSFLTRLSRKLPSYHLLLSNDPLEIGEALRNFLSTLPPEGSAD